ncbi:hypothetical protein F4820DRAFT_244971 [Hypoxylon rubiginosum]|uniref:Uncharacterized protein n=1 Tax=Hypoxylon rubiginosum TaxID=110542 RepID=A0ACB9Z4V3_9PEZI|nr:hypothetical protein F4820DRAFT_244971 [Hypoxylon rubiginosum]
MSLGPLTTSFTPPADCVASSALYWVNTASTFYWLHGQPLQTSCFPDNYSPYQNQYYSPGICPSGYTKACESLSTSGALATVTRATCCPQGNYVCASTSSSYSYPWGPTLGCMSVYRVDTETAFTTIDGTPRGGETAGTPMSIFAPGTIMAYGIVIRNSETATATTAAETTTQPTSGSASDTLQTATSALASETASSSTGVAAAGETQAGSSGSGGLSTGAAAGIGIATAVGIMSIGGAALWTFWTRRRKRKQAEEERARAAMSPATWSATTWTTPLAPHPHQRAAIQVNWQPTELANEGEPREMSAEGRLLPVEKDGGSSHWR